MKCEVKVTVIIPMYNSEKYIKKCVESIIEQTYKNIEILVINDGSTDNSLGVLDEINDSRIKIINQNNHGVSYSRNMGIENSLGKYIFFIDADDWIDSKAIENLVNIAVCNNVDIVKCNFCRENGKKMVKNDISNLNNICKKNILKCDYENLIYAKIPITNFFNVVWGQLIKKDIISELFDKRICFGEDFLFNVKLLKNSKSIYIYNEVLYHYTTNNNGINRNKSIEKTKIKCEDLMNVYAEILSILKDNIDKEIFKKFQIKFLEDILNKFFDVLSIDLNNKEKVKFIEMIFENKKYNNCIDELKPNELKIKKSKKSLLLRQMVKKRKYTIFIVSCFVYMPIKRILKFFSERSKYFEKRRANS